MIYLLYGSNALARSEFVAALKEKMARLPMGTENTLAMDGKEITVQELSLACRAAPFFGEKRMAIVEGLLERLGAGPSAHRKRPATRKPVASPPAMEELVELCLTLPESTHLVFVEGEIDPTALVSALPSKQLVARRFETPGPKALHRWVTDRARRRGGVISAEAAQMLVETVGPDMAMLDNEIAKLVTFRFGQVVGTEDLRAVASQAEASVFELVDALAEGRLADSLVAARRLEQQGQPAESFIAAVAAHFRRLLQVREMLGMGLSPYDEAPKHGISATPRYVAKLMSQAGRFTPEELEAALRRLAQWDLTIKAGKIEPAVALELIAWELTREKSAGADQAMIRA